MAESASSPKTLLTTLLSTIESSIIPLTAEGVSNGCKLFGAAILSKHDLKPITVATNNEKASPLLHGEINCIQQFFSSPTTLSGEPRPSTKDCVFLATHEPCSLCLSGITWSGFDNFYYLFTYEDSRSLFSIPYDIQIIEEVFRVRAEGENDEALKARALYNKKNAFFTSKSFEELVQEVEKEEGEDEGKRLRGEVERVKGLYNGLSETYQKGKAEGVESSSFWK
jgi:tRNA(Arg) A34 adenosine deaminase TadA